jgi:hypothetical protein
MRDVKTQVLDAYNYWRMCLTNANIPQEYWNVGREKIVKAAYGEKNAVNFIYDRPDVWTRGYVVLIDGISGSIATPPNEVRRKIGMACLVAAMSYIAVSDDFSSPEIMYVDFDRFQSILEDNTKKNAYGDAMCEAAVLLITEMKSGRAKTGFHAEYCSSKIDEIMRSRSDSGKTTIITFADGCSQCLREGRCGLEIGRLLTPVHKNLSIVNEERKIIRISTKPHGTEDDKGEDADAGPKSPVSEEPSREMPVEGNNA